MEISTASVENYMQSLDLKRQGDVMILIKLMKKITKKEPRMWGSIIGFGRLHYRYKTGHQGEMPLIGLSSRKQAITLYLAFDISKYRLRQQLGQYKIGKSCLYIKSTKEIDLVVLESLVKQCIQDTLNLAFITDLDAHK